MGLHIVDATWVLWIKLPTRLPGGDSVARKSEAPDPEESLI